MNVAKGADYTDFLQTSNNLYAFQTKKADINISAFSNSKINGYGK